jgi:LacI family transcriptional regulator
MSSAARRVIRDRKKVVLLLGGVSFHEELILGIAEYAQARRWHARRERVTPGLKRVLAEDRPDGVVAHVTSREAATEFIASGIPTVNVSASVAGLPLPSVLMDNVAVGRVAAEHLLDRGFRHLCFLQRSTLHYEEQRRQGFERRVREAGLACEVVDPGASGAEVTRWLRGLPRPVGIFCATDSAGAGLAADCYAMGIVVPHEVAILGCDNAEGICMLSLPPLSSVDVASRRHGLEVARVLEDLMEGRRTPSRPVLVPPAGVVTRVSTDVLGVRDPHLREALAYIDANLHAGIRVADVLRHVGVSRRILERAFRDHLESTPLAEIRRRRLKFACELLGRADHPIAEVAELAGFGSPVRMSIVFREMLGVSPREYRLRLQSGSRPVPAPRGARARRAIR